MEATFDGVLYLCKTHQPHHRRSNFSRLFRSTLQNYMTSYITANCIIISTQCNKLGEKGQSAIQVEEVKKKSEEIPTAEAFLLRAPPTPAPEVSSLTLLQQLLFTIAPAKTVVGPCEGNDPIFTEVVESKSSVNLGGGRCPRLASKASNTFQQVLALRCCFTMPHICSGAHLVWWAE